MRKKAGQPYSKPSIWLSQSSVLANQLCTTRTTQVPPERASTIHSVAIVGAFGPRSGLSALNRRGGAHARVGEAGSLARPQIAAPGPPSRSSGAGGTHH